MQIGKQLAIFLDNRPGMLARVADALAEAKINIYAITTSDTVDHSVIRMVLSDPERGLEVLEQAKLPCTESDLLVVQLPESSHPLPQICKTLLAAEINIDYAYQLLVGSQARPALALRVDDLETAVSTLRGHGYTIFTEGDLSQ